jgi:hypothetical protein
MFLHRIEVLSQLWLCKVQRESPSTTKCHSSAPASFAASTSVAINYSGLYIRQNIVFLGMCATPLKNQITLQNILQPTANQRAIKQAR